MTADDSLIEVATALYAGRPEDFVAARKAQAQACGDRALAARILELRKPSVAAWVVNVFAAARRTQWDEALRLAAELREAQSELDAASLAALGRQRRALTDRLAREAAELASAQGARLTASTVEAVRQTISAAFFDEDAAAAASSGRLVRELSPAQAVDLDAAVGGGAPRGAAAVDVPVDEVSARRERRRAEAAVRDAEQARVRAQREVVAAEREVRDATARIVGAADSIARLESELDAARTAARRAEADAATAAAHRDEATARAADAERAVATAQRALDAL